MNRDLKNRLFQFSVDTNKKVRTLPYKYEYKIISHQVLKLFTLVCINYEEAHTAVYKT